MDAAGNEPALVRLGPGQVTRTQPTTRAIRLTRARAAGEHIIGRPHHVGDRDDQRGVRGVRRIDPSVLFAAMDSAINWNEAEGNPLAESQSLRGSTSRGRWCVRADALSDR